MTYIFQGPVRRIQDIGTLYSIAETLRGACLRSIDSQNLFQRMESFLIGYHAILAAIGPEMIWVRARLCDAYNAPIFNNVNDLLYIQDWTKVQFGRANLARNAAPYASSTESVAAEEIGIETGQRVQFVYVRPRQGVVVPCGVIGLYESHFASGKSYMGSEQHIELLNHQSRNDKHHYGSSVFIDSFMTKEFRKICGTHHDYKLTAIYTNSMYGGGANGFIYPSVQSPWSLNLAVAAQLFDRFFEVTHTTVMRVRASAGFGLFKLQLEAQAHDFLEDGTIQWDSLRRRRLEIREHRLTEPNYAPGWRKTMATGDDPTT
ncbi:hypothetical protein [Massilia eurypsychrophila]|nr:hypothetical protein [Massilia eurypsychrophila]